MATTALLERLPLSSPHLRKTTSIPVFIYGTAWKKDASADLVYQALSNGFTAVDTAAQPKHYKEHLVAAGISNAIKDGHIRRSDLYLQTKFTSTAGQDPDDLPYDPKSPLPDQVNSSVMSSLQNFNFGDVVGQGDAGDPYIDTLILHSPMNTMAETLQVWETLEQYVPGEIRHLGISNCNLFTLMELYERARIKPAVVQNRFHAATKYDIGLRKFCVEKGIVYQSFWTLTANPALLRSKEVSSLASALDSTPAAAMYVLVLSLGYTTILNGTTQVKNMRDDWKSLLTAQTYAKAEPEAWLSLTSSFRQLLGDKRS